MASHHIIDRSLKTLARYAPAAFLRLAGEEVDENTIRFEDVAVNIPDGGNRDIEGSQLH